jgi:hypothetical protein
MAARIVSELIDSQRALAYMTDRELVDSLVDAAIAVALRRGVTPQQVLRDGVHQFGFTEEGWAEIRDGIEAVLRSGRGVEGADDDAD